MGRTAQIVVFAMLALVALVFDFALIVSGLWGVALFVAAIAVVCAVRVWGAITRRASGTSAESERAPEHP
jgi:1,4-dihydroxy-2-naphthoate octaprenyltransferase